MYYTNRLELVPFWEIYLISEGILNLWLDRLEAVYGYLDTALAYFLSSGIYDEETDSVITGKPIGEIETTENVVQNRGGRWGIEQGKPLTFGLGAEGLEIVAGKCVGRSSAEEGNRTTGDDI